MPAHVMGEEGVKCAGPHDGEGGVKCAGPHDGGGGD